MAQFDFWGFLGIFGDFWDLEDVVGSLESKVTSSLTFFIFFFFSKMGFWLNLFWEWKFSLIWNFIILPLIIVFVFYQSFRLFWMVFFELVNIEG